MIFLFISKSKIGIGRSEAKAHPVELSFAHPMASQ